VFEREKIALGIGDRIRFTKNVKHRGQKFLNNELRTVVSIDEGKIIFEKGEIGRNGAALHLDQGIAPFDGAQRNRRSFTIFSDAFHYNVPAHISSWLAFRASEP
jgi:hypothetical protein